MGMATDVSAVEIGRLLGLLGDSTAPWEEVVQLPG